MAQNEVMKRLFFIIAILFAGTLSAQEYSWKSVPVDGSRTGCISPSKDNVREALGYFKGGKYIAPDEIGRASCRERV